MNISVGHTDGTLVMNTKVAPTNDPKTGIKMKLNAQK